MEIRRARAADAELLTDLAFRSKQANGYDDAFMAACVEELAVTPARIASERIWLAEASGTPLGCVSLSCIAGPQAEVSLFFVVPDRLRQGIGKRLWQHVEADARSLGIRRLTLDADPAAVPFYTSLGFTVTGNVPSGSIPGRFIPQMSIELAAD